jgi:hypothetical protein
VEHQAIEPCIEPVRFTQPGERSPHLDEGLLDGVLGGVLVAQDHPRHGGEPTDRPRHELREGITIASPRPDHEIAHRSPPAWDAATRRGTCVPIRKPEGSIVGATGEAPLIAAAARRGFEVRAAD